VRVALKTLGCRLNEAELENWSNDFLNLGYTISNDPESADFVVLNTCAVTQGAVKKSRQIIRKIHRTNPMAKLIVSGCYASLNPEIENEFECIDLLVSNSNKDSLARIVDQQLSSDAMPKLAAEVNETPLFLRGRNRAFIKVQDGCRYSCTFCIVTKARGNERSKSIAEVVNQINTLQNQDIKEVILTGVHIGGYGSDRETDLYTLIDSVLKETDVERLRLGSVEPWDLSENFFELLSNPRFMPHLHLPLQSGSDTVLRRMARRCKTKDFEQLLIQLRSCSQDFNVTTDIIVGFPGEGDREWQESMEFVESCGFSHIHIFPYSPRQGTKAATFAEQVSPAAKKLRVQQLNLLAKRMRMEKMNHFRGSHFQVLVENCSETVIDGKLDYFGYTPNYLKVKIPSLDDPSLINNIRTVALTNYDEQSTLMNARFIDTIEAVNI
jgi:threonylcarbamoyladenosine tRNA methylthiotransferase MtaB